MSRHHQSRNNEVAHMIMDAEQMTHHQLMSTYNVEVWEDGRVYDLTEDTVYSNVSQWANATIEGDDIDYDDKYGDKYSDMEEF